MPFDLSWMKAAEVIGKHARMIQLHLTCEKKEIINDPQAPSYSDIALTSVRKGEQEDLGLKLN